MGLYDYTIYSFIKRNARVNGNRTALISGNQKITHRQFLEKVDQLSCGLLGAGLKRGDRIGVLGQNSLEYVYLYGAAAKVGAIMIPINWRLDPEEIKYVISDGAPKILFASPEFQDTIRPLVSRLDCIEKTFTLGQAQGSFSAFDDLMDSKGISPDVNVCSDDDYVIIQSIQFYN